MRIPTADGEEIDTGFWGPDTSRVQLGELPPMTVQQFVGFAAATLTEHIIPHMDSTRRSEWAGYMQSVRERVGSLATREATGQFSAQNIEELTNQLGTTPQGSRRELMDAIAAQTWTTDEAEFYRSTPFVIQADGQRIGFAKPGDGVRHVVEAEDFFNLTAYVVNGGWAGWGRGGTYPEVKAAAMLLDTVLSNQ